MKKLLIFMLVLCLASLANASITFTSPGLLACPHEVGADFDVLPGQIVTIQIYSPDTITTSSYMVSVTESTTSAAGHSAAPAVGVLNAGFDLTRALGNLRNCMTNSGAGTPRYMLIDRISGSIDIPNGSPSIPAGAILYSFELKIPENAVYCDLFTITAAVGTPVFSPPPAGYGHQQNAVNVLVTDPLILHVGMIPEPATIALLGLGGLLLRRRK